MDGFPTVAALRRLLADRPLPPLDGVEAAVMACLHEGAAGVEVLLCRRAVHPGDPWSGHISLPGGRIEPDDSSPLAAAARETLEEVGFDPLVRGSLLGPLPSLFGRLNTVRVAPFAAVIEAPIEPSPSAELAAAWWQPLAALRPTEAAVPELRAPVPAYLAAAPDGVPAVVWGMTHRVLESLRAAADPAPG